MKYIISGTKLKQVDNYTINTIGIPSVVLMERAAVSVAEEILCHAKKEDAISVVCGIGNNGADGVAIARILSVKGYSTCVYILGNTEHATEEFNLQLSAYKKIGGNIKEFNGSFEGNIIVDAIFGIGLSRDVGGRYKDAIELINNMSSKVVSVDVPSGINSDNGKVMGVAVKADVTVTFGVNKTGIIFYPGADYAGRVIVKDIGFPKVAFDDVELYKYITKKDFNLIPKRKNDSNKGTYGKVLVIAGSEGMSGAALMCAKSALRIGSGMVKVFTTKENEGVIKTSLPEVMVTIYNTDDYKDKLKKDLSWCDVVVAGPGIGVGETQADIVYRVLESKLPCVIDADGINCISQSETIREKLHKNVIITPHIGEMARFSGLEIMTIKSDIINVAKEWASKYGITIILKDARTVISDGNEVFINLSGNNGMSTAGSGDVLAGITAGLMALGMEPVVCAAMSAYIHGMAGDMAAEKKSKTSLIATDIIDEIIEITKTIESY